MLERLERVLIQANDEMHEAASSMDGDASTWPMAKRFLQRWMGTLPGQGQELPRQAFMNVVDAINLNLVAVQGIVGAVGAEPQEARTISINPDALAGAMFAARQILDQINQGVKTLSNLPPKPRQAAA